MPATLLATQCPAPIVEANYPKLSLSENTNGTDVNVARAFSAGDTATVPASLNRNANNLDLLATFGGGGFGILTGLALSAGSGLNVSISAGLAAGGGLIELASVYTLPVPGNHPGTTDVTDRVWIWIQQNGTPTYTLNTTPPSVRCVLLGSVTTDGSGVTSVDTSGVLYLKGGSLWRETADPGPPGDSPSATLTLFTKTPGGVFFWDTVSHRAVYAPMSPNKTTLSSTEAAKIAANEQVIVYDSLTVDGDLVIDGDLVLL
jgi:hypothetical protein